MCNGDEIQICWCCIVLNILIGNQAAYIDKFFNKLFQELSEDERDSFRFDVKIIEWKNHIENIHIP